MQQDDPTRAVVQVVTSASVTVHDPDGPSRVTGGFDERSASDLGAPVLVVSQFTLYADLGKGRRPSWSAAAPRPVSEPLVAAFCDALRERGAKVEAGVFGADMALTLVNDGPRTIVLEA